MRIACWLAFLCLTLNAAEVSKAPPILPPDDRYKADLLLVVAHPDDDVVIGGYLARVALDQHKRVAVIYCTPGDGGGNAVGYEAGLSLGQMRMIEARRALAAYGIANVWFLGGHDTPGQDVLWSLDNWNHGKALDEMVRLMRITRPEVVMTWLPDYVVGENHADHQAAGVLATEAFDMAGDPLQFPEQISAPRNRVGMMNRTEGLHPWQPKKLYYATDAFEDFGPYWSDKQDLSPYRKNFLDGAGPSYSSTEVSPSRRESYAKLTAEHQQFYLTQEGYLGVDALKTGNFKGFDYPDQLIFGKSLVGGTVTGDVFEDVQPRPIAFAKVPGYEASPEKDVAVQLEGPWRFYQEFWKAHKIDRLASLIPVPEVSIGIHQTLHIPLLLRNETSTAKEFHLSVVLPEGWTDGTRFSVYPVAPGEAYPVDAALVPPPHSNPRWQEITWKAEAGGQPAGSVTMRVHVSEGGGLPE